MARRRAPRFVTVAPRPAPAAGPHPPQPLHGLAASRRWAQACEIGGRHWPTRPLEAGTESRERRRCSTRSASVRTSTILDAGEQALQVQFARLGRERAQGQRQQGTGRHRLVQHRVPQREPGAAARQRVRNLRQMLQQPRSAPRVEAEVGVAQSTDIRQDEVDAACSASTPATPHRRAPAMCSRAPPPRPASSSCCGQRAGE
jgi:hypothetical protein